MPTTLQQVEKALGTDKFVVLASAVDHVIEAQSCLQEKNTIDDQIETLDMHELARQYNVSFDTLRKQINGVLGDSAVFKVGRKWVIRKRRFLDFLQARESRNDSDMA